MRKTNFSFLPESKRFFYEQWARSFRIQLPQKHDIWAPFTSKLLESKIALVSVTGAYLEGQKPFTNEDIARNYEYREIPLDFNRPDLHFMAHDWEASEALLDPNVIMPVDRLILLQKEGMIGKIHDPIYSFSGFNSHSEHLKKNVQKLAKSLKGNEPQGILIIPCSAVTSQTAVAIATELETVGFPTAMLSLFYEQAVILAPPRCAFINFPFGRTLGKPNHVTLHTAILRDTLRLFEKAKSPGMLLGLNYIWSCGEIPVW